ncbi:MAG: dTDP-glucose 4,6-dehydratase [Pseudomonadota bacterium]
MKTQNRPSIWITGGSGFIGSNLVRTAIAQGYRVVNLDALTYAGNRKNHEDLEGTEGYEFVHGSIGDRPLVQSLFQRVKPRAILNLAAESHVDRSIDGPAPFIETNLVGTFVLLDEARRYVASESPDERGRFRFLHVSTDEVYGSVTEGASKEDASYEPNSPYAASKAGADHLVRAYGKTFGLPVLTTNCSNNYGPYQFPEKLIPLTILNALEGVPLPVYGDGKQVRDWLYVEDHCEAILTVLAKGKAGEKYNVGAEMRVENLDLVRKLCRILDGIRPRTGGKRYEELISFVADRPGHDRRYALDPGKIMKSLGWRPAVSLEEGLERTVRWYLDHSEWWTEIRRRNYAGERLGLGHA